MIPNRPVPPGSAGGALARGIGFYGNIRSMRYALGACILYEYLGYLVRPGYGLPGLVYSLPGTLYWCPVLFYPVVFYPVLSCGGRRRHPQPLLGHTRSLGRRPGCCCWDAATETLLFCNILPQSTHIHTGTEKIHQRSTYISSGIYYLPRG